MITKVVLPKNEYEKLRRQASAYRRLAARVFESVIKDPIEEVIIDFRNTGLYTEAFLEDLGDGLRRSSYAKRHAH